MSCYAVQAMRASILAAAVLLVTAATGGILACRGAGGPRGAQPLATASQRTASHAGVSRVSSAAAASAAAADAAPSLDDALKQLAACADPIAQIVNHPGGGTVFNNAMTAADAGSIDRAQGVLDAIAAKQQALRCCFDPWLAETTEAKGRVLLRVTLDEDGKVTAAAIDAARSDIHHGTTSACLLAVVRAIDYPPSPTRKETIVQYPVVVARSASR